MIKILKTFWESIIEAQELRAKMYAKHTTWPRGE